MGIIRPATPGFLVTLAATALLAVVSFCVPYFKSVYFLKATINLQNNVSGSITFGTLGYCLELGGSVSCSKPAIGYQLDINGLVGNKLPVEIPQVVVKWITYVLFLHVVALVAATASSIFGLLAHVREMSMACCSTCFSGIAAAITLLAFIFDLVLFFVAKSRINAIGSASIGMAIWLTLAAWILLFFSGCFFALGRCCISKRPSGGKNSRWEPPPPGAAPPPAAWNARKDPEAGLGYARDPNEQLRLDAVKAEADRKAKQKQGEGGLPTFYETQPLTGHVEGDQVYLDGEHSESHSHLTAAAAPPARQQGYMAGYAPATPGSRTVDDYYAVPATNTYPPAPRRQRSEQSNFGQSPSHTPAPGGYAAGYGQYNARGTTSPPPANHNMLAVPGQYGADPYAREYGHQAGGTSYHTANSQHGQSPSAYSNYDAYDPYNTTQPQQPTHAQAALADNPYLSNPYGATPAPTQSPSMPSNAYPSPSTYYAGTTASSTSAASSIAPPPPSKTPELFAPQPSHPERSYTLGGDGYGANAVPPLPDHAAMSPPQVPPHDSPPGYETGTSGVQGNWGKR